MGMPRPYVTHDQLDDMLGYHPATDVTGPVHAAVRQAVAAVGHRLIELVPEGPAKTTAINKLREAMMWANAAVACQADPIWQREVAALRGDDPMYPRLVLETPPHPLAGMTPGELAQIFHEAYERRAPEFGYKTREASAVPWHEVPPQNAALMAATCSDLLGVDVPSWAAEQMIPRQAVAVDFEGTEGAIPVPAAVDEFLERPETGTRRERPAE